MVVKITRVGGRRDKIGQSRFVIESAVISRREHSM